MTDHTVFRLDSGDRFEIRRRRWMLRSIDHDQSNDLVAELFHSRSGDVLFVPVAQLLTHPEYTPLGPVKS